MKKHKKILASLTALIILLSLVSGCAESKKTAGTAVSEERILVNGISYVIDTEADPTSYEKAESLGVLEGNASYEVSTVKNDDQVLLCTENENTMVFRKEYAGMNTEIRTVMTSNGTMDYFCFGNEDGENVIVLPGVSLKSVMGAADAVVSAYALLAEDYHVYLFDHVRELPGNCRIETMADDTLAAMKNAGIEKAHLMGVSLGGMIAQTMALKSPETVSSLVLCSSTSRVSDSTKSVFEEWRSLAEKRDLRKLSESFGEHVYSPSFYEQYKEPIIASNDGATELNYTNFLISLSAMDGFDVYERLSEIQCPVFVIGAGEDRIVGRESSDEIMEKLDCPGYIYEGYGHGVYDEAPDYLARVKDYIGSVR